MIRKTALLWLGMIISASSWIVSDLGAEEVDVESDKRFNAVAWMQNSAEYRLLTEQVFRSAQTQLQIGLHDPNWSADEVQLADNRFQQKKPAVILDCDETVLDNSAFNARNIADGLEYSRDSWNAWCSEANAGAVPGSLEFVNAAKALGARVFFVTNREDLVKDATIRNLNALGFTATAGNVLTKNPEQGRGGDKISRRAMVARNHRIVLLIGDNMGDLCSGMDTTNSEERNRTASVKQSMLGSRWFMLPNPVYGGWQRALPTGRQALMLSR